MRAKNNKDVSVIMCFWIYDYKFFQNNKNSVGEDRVFLLYYLTNFLLRHQWDSNPRSKALQAPPLDRSGIVPLL